MRVIHSQGDQRISIVPIHPVTGAPVIVDLGSDVTVSIVDLRHGETSDDHTVLAPTTVAQDSFSSALTGAAGYSQPDPHRIPADASTAALGRSYLLEASDGRLETVQLRAIGGTTSASSVHQLRANYTTGDTLRGVELVATFPEAEANDEDSVEDKGGPYLVTWSYLVDGQTVVLPTELFLDRYSLAPSIDDAWVLKGAPDMANRGRQQVGTAISAAWDDWMAKVETYGKDPSLFLASHVVKVALRHLALSYLHRWASGGQTDDDRADALELKASNMFNDVLVGNAPKRQVELTRNEVGNVDQPKGHIFGLS